MLRFNLAAAIGLFFSSSVCAHEFWIVPEDMVLDQGDRLKPVLMIGEYPDGKAYRFQPQAYARAIWSGAEQEVELSRLPLAGPKPALTAFAPGLHSLSVSTFPQKLTYDTPAHFLSFLAEIGREDVIASLEAKQGSLDNINETYRRFSKTLIHFAEPTGKDRRIGLEREWVSRDGKFTLYDGDQPAEGQHVRVFCTAGQGTETGPVETLHTGEDGSISPKIPASTRCLINTVFLDFDDAQDQWHSEWVSLYFMAP